MPDGPELDAPETPAPVFAARALKSAIFGTPAPPPGDETLYEIERQEAAIAKPSGTYGQADNVSPTKPQGILLTPGTATSRRKRVSFGNEVAEKKDGLVGCRALALKRLQKSDGSADGVGERTLEEDSSRRAPKKTSLTRTLENAREGKSKPDASKALPDTERNSVKTSPRKTSSSKNMDLEFTEANHEVDGNITIDLNEPQSQSGRYWKSQYQSYHEDAKAEMQLLLRYKYLAKSYAKKKDSEAVDLAEKLKEEQLKVIEKEAQISKLSAQISNPDSEGEDDEDSLELIKEVAKQRALVAQYKAQVEEFRVALEEPDGPRKAEWGEGKLSDGRSSREISRLGNELENVRKLLAAAERKNQKLQEDNTKLAQELLHAELALEKQKEKSDQRQQTHEEQIRKKEEKIETLQQEYKSIKDLAKSDRQSAEHLLDKRHTQIQNLRKDLDSLRSTETAFNKLEKDFQQKTEEHDRIVADLRRQLANSNLQGNQSTDEGLTLPEEDMTPIRRRKSALLNDASPSRESLIPVSVQSISRNNRVSRDELLTGAPRTSQRPLCEIVNSASVDTVPPKTSGPVQFTPLATRFSDMTLDSPALDLPSMEPSFSQDPVRKPNLRTGLPSPRPSRFNIPSSPPQPVTVRPRPSASLLRQRSNNDIGGQQTHLASRRMSSLESSRVRGNLPPDRIAAAQARLEQKKAAKSKAQSKNSEKENVRN